MVTSVVNARTGTTTHGKQKGVAYYIKATSAGPEVEPDIYATKGLVQHNLDYGSTMDGTVNGIYSGYITGSRTRILFEIPCNTVGLETVNISRDMGLTMRGTQGYIRNSFDSPIVMDGTNYLWSSHRTDDAYRITPAGIILNAQLANGGEWSTSSYPVTNNTPIVVEILNGVITLGYGE